MGSLEHATLSVQERRAVQRLVDALRRELGKSLVSVWLYGSQARRGATARDSDVDLLVVTQGGHRQDFDRVLELAMDAAEAEGISIFRVSPVITDPGWISDRRAISSSFIRAVDRDKIVLAGEP